MARKKYITLPNAPHIKFANKLDSDIYFWLKRYGVEFERNRKVVLWDRFTYTNEIIPPLTIKIHYTFFNSDGKIVAYLLLKPKYFGFNPIDIKLPLLKKRLSLQKGCPFVFCGSDVKGVNEALQIIFDLANSKKQNTAAARPSVTVPAKPIGTPFVAPANSQPFNQKSI